MPNPSYDTANRVLAAARELGLDESSFHQPPGFRARAVIERVIDRFTKQGGEGNRGCWLWRDLREPHFFLPEPQDLQVLFALGPPTTPVWLIVEDFGRTKSGPPFWLFEANLASTVATLENHHLLEFYVVSRQIDWLVGENHHDIMFAAGDHAIAALQGA